MSIEASCGHELTEAEGMGNNIALKRIAKDGKRVVEHSVVCNYCYNRYKSQTTLVLYTKRAQQNWLSGKLKIESK